MAYTTEIYFLTVLVAEKSKIKAPENSIWGEGSLLGLRVAVLVLCPHMIFSLCSTEGGRERGQDKREREGGREDRRVERKLSGVSASFCKDTSLTD